MEDELDWADFIHFGGRRYYLSGEDIDVQLGEVVGRVRCRLIGSGTPSGYRSRDGDAAYLDVGTLLHRVAGRPLSDALGVRYGDQVEVYEPE